MPRRKHQLIVSDDRAALQQGSLWWAYCRVTLGEKQVIASQKRAVPEFADRHQLVMAHWWVDDHVSGSCVEGRHAFGQMIEESATPRAPSPASSSGIWPVGHATIWSRNTTAPTSGPTAMPW